MNIPFPNMEQIQRFKEHVINVHSWYKHLPLLEGGKFVVYLEADLDREYPTQHPKLPFGNTKEGYEKAFGHLCYMYFINDFWYLPYNSKMVEGKRIEIEKPVFSDKHIEMCSFTLFPFCHQEFEVGYYKHKEAIEKIVAGYPHPESKLLLAWYKEYCRIEGAENRDFNYLEHKLLLIEEEKGIAITENELPKRVRPYWASKKRRYHYLKALQQKEAQKVENAIHQLILLHQI